MPHNLCQSVSYHFLLYILISGFGEKFSCLKVVSLLLLLQSEGFPVWRRKLVVCTFQSNLLQYTVCFKFSWQHKETVCHVIFMSMLFFRLLLACIKM